MSLCDYSGPFHDYECPTCSGLPSPQHKGYPDAPSRTVAPSGDQTATTLPASTPATVERLTCVREKERLLARIEWLENRLQQREDTISTLVDRLAENRTNRNLFNPLDEVRKQIERLGNIRY